MLISFIVINMYIYNVLNIYNMFLKYICRFFKMFLNRFFFLKVKYKLFLNDVFINIC